MKRGWMEEQARINLPQGFRSFLLSSHPSLSSPFFVASYFFHPTRTPPPLYSLLHILTPIPIRASSQPCSFYSSR